MSNSWDESGSVMVEYALVLALLSVAFIAGLFTVEATTDSVFTNMQQEMIHYGLRDGQ
jgi:Flp pilus assembly pilin Flp